MRRIRMMIQEQLPLEKLHPMFVSSFLLTPHTMTEEGEVLHHFTVLFSRLIQIIERISITTGNTAAKAKPALISEPNASAILPVSDGPDVQPISPAKASIANIAVPPIGIALLARLNVPGHIIPTESPHNAQPARDKRG